MIGESLIKQKSLEFSFYYIPPLQQRGTFHVLELSLFSLSLDNEHELMLKGNQIN